MKTGKKLLNWISTMEHNIHLTKNDSSESYWVESTTDARYSIPTKPIELMNHKELIPVILDEFIYTSPSMRLEMEKQLMDWLSEMNDTDLDIIETAKVRDFIYEMF